MEHPASSVEMLAFSDLRLLPEINDIIPDSCPEWSPATERRIGVSSQHKPLRAFPPVGRGILRSAIALDLDNGVRLHTPLLLPGGGPGEVPRRTPVKPTKKLITYALKTNQHTKKHGTRSKKPNRDTEELVDLPESDICLGVCVLPEEIKEMILLDLLEVSMPEKLHLKALPDNKGYFTTTTVEGGSIPPPHQALQTYCNHLPGAFQLTCVYNTEILEHTFVDDAEMQKDRVMVVDKSFKFPLALHLDNALRKMWAEEMFEGTVFWVDSAYIDGYERWAMAVNPEHFEKTKVMVGWL